MNGSLENYLRYRREFPDHVGTINFDWEVAQLPPTAVSAPGLISTGGGHYLATFELSGADNLGTMDLTFCRNQDVCAPVAQDRSQLRRLRVLFKRLMEPQNTPVFLWLFIDLPDLRAQATWLATLARWDERGWVPGSGWFFQNGNIEDALRLHSTAR